MMAQELKVVVTDHLFEDLKIEHRILGKINAKICDCGKENLSLAEETQDADAILTTYADINENIIANLEKCKIIARYGIGVDNVAMEAAIDKGIYVTNVPDYCIDEVSDHTLALILASLRKIIPYSLSTRAGEWDVNVGKPISRVQDLILGLVAFGKISREVAHKASAIGFKVLAYDPYLPEKHMRKEGVKPTNFDGLLEKSDVVSIHSPLTEETKHMISKDEFSKMKTSAILINAARGPIVDTKSLSNALEEGEIKGAALDVIEDAPLDSDSPLLERDDVIVTPHAAWYSEDSLIELREKAATNVLQALKGEVPKYLLNEEITRA